MGACGRSLVSEPYANALAALRLGESRPPPHPGQQDVYPFSQGKHLLIILQVWLLKDTRWVFSLDGEAKL